MYSIIEMRFKLEKLTKQEEEADDAAIRTKLQEATADRGRCSRR